MNKRHRGAGEEGVRHPGTDQQHGDSLMELRLCPTCRKHLSGPIWMNPREQSPDEMFEALRELPGSKQGADGEPGDSDEAMGGA